MASRKSDTENDYEYARTRRNHIIKEAIGNLQYKCHTNNLKFVTFVEEHNLMDIVKFTKLFCMLKMNKPTTSTIFKDPTILTLTHIIRLGRTIKILQGAITTTSDDNTHHHKRRR